MPEAKYEGAFWYHHIQNHPDFDEMARQHVRYIWTSFWFPYQGEWLPAEKEWYPYTYNRWFMLKQKMNDGIINAFVKEMHDHGIGVYAFFNVCEYGGGGGQGGEPPSQGYDYIEKHFADAIAKDANGNSPIQWDGSRGLNPDPRYSYLAHLREHVRRHLQRLPGIDGFCIDRMDWANVFDFAHDDGLTMFALRPATNMAEPVAKAVQEVCRLNHAAGKRVFVNQFWRVEPLRDVDGSCHEDDCLAQRYLIPLRPASAWNYVKPYQGDLLAFEGQLKQRLQIALFPHMITHNFWICQQGRAAGRRSLGNLRPAVRVADRQAPSALRPLRVGHGGERRESVSQRVGPLRRSRHVAGPLSVARRSRHGDRDRPPERRRRRGTEMAHVYSADARPRRATIAPTPEGTSVLLDRHATASVLLLGKGAEPPLADGDAAAIAATRDRLFPRLGRTAAPAANATGKETVPFSANNSGSGFAPPKFARATLQILGVHLGPPGAVRVAVNGEAVGTISTDRGTFAWSPKPTDRSDGPPTVSLSVGDDGMWYVPRRIRLTPQGNDRGGHVAQWTPDVPPVRGASGRETVFPLKWAKLEDCARGDGPLRGQRRRARRAMARRVGIAVGLAGGDQPRDAGAQRIQRMARRRQPPCLQWQRQGPARSRAAFAVRRRAPGCLLV